MLRRDFFRDALAVVSGAATLAAASRVAARELKIPESGQADPRDAPFWRQVREQFPHIPPSTVVAAIGPRTATDAQAAGLTGRDDGDDVRRVQVVDALIEVVARFPLLHATDEAAP